jgi:CubicO group peptidase (beta-lactamase class C family)
MSPKNGCMTMRTIWLVAALSILTLQPVVGQELPLGIPEDFGMSSQRLEAITDLLQGYTDDGLLPGAVVSIIRNGHVVHESVVGFRDRERGEALAADDIFRIASQTKAIVSVGVLMLQERGHLLISDPLGKYLPEYAETTVALASDEGYEVVAAEQPITIRHLLTHTAGIGYGWGVAAAEWDEADIQGWYFGHREEPIRETVRQMAALPMDAHPGTEYVYGYSTDILGALIEVVSGQQLDAFMQNNLFDPLHMHDTHFYLPEEKRDRLAVVYSLSESGLERSPDDSDMAAQGGYVDGPRASFSGGAGLLSTARDYGRFMQMMLNEGELNGMRVLSPSSVRLMTANHLDQVEYPWARGAGFGLGFMVLEDVGAFGAPGSPGEYGWGGAYHSTYWADPEEDLVVIYFTQVIPATGLDDHGKLRAMVHGSILE